MWPENLPQARGERARDFHFGTGPRQEPGLPAPEWFFFSCFCLFVLVFSENIALVKSKLFSIEF
jgi:hypothetical protein